MIMMVEIGCLDRAPSPQIGRMRDHRSLHAWQEAREVVLGVISLACTNWKPYAAAVFSQLQRASLSVQLNIAEGYAFGKSPTFRRHLAIAYGSAIETGELLQVALDSKVIPINQGKYLLSRTQRSQRLLLGMLRKMNRPEQTAHRPRQS
jgi:four helix bundle protein